MSYQKRAEEIAFNRDYSRFKIHLYFKKRRTITHYGQERYGCTVAQIQHRYVNQFFLDRERGLQDCIDRIAICEKLYDESPHTVLIYDKDKNTMLPDGSVQRGKEIRKYMNGQLIEWEEAFQSPREKKVLVSVVWPPQGGFKLIRVVTEDAPPPGKEESKKIVATALAKPTTRQDSLRYKEPKF